MRQSSSSLIAALILSLSFGSSSAVLAETSSEAEEEPEAYYRSHSYPLEVYAGEPFGAHLEYENRGDNIWSTESGYALKPIYEEDATLWDIEEVPLRIGEEIEPGQRKIFAFTIRAPLEPGEYRFAWQLSFEGEGIDQPGPEQMIRVVPTPDDVDPDPIFFRRHTGSFEVHPRRPFSLRTDDGQPIHLLGKTAYALLARPGPGRYLEDALQQGFNMVRVFMLVPDLLTQYCFPPLGVDVDPIYLDYCDGINMNETGWPWEGTLDTSLGFERRRNQYWSRLDTLMDQADERGMVVELTLFTAGSLTYFPSELGEEGQPLPVVLDDTKRAYIRAVLEQLGDRRDDNGNLARERKGQASIEIADEYQTAADGPGPYPHAGISEEFVREAGAYIKEQEADIAQIRLEDVKRIVTVSGQPADGPPLADEPWNDVLTLHLPNHESWPTRIRDIILGLRERENPKPIVDDHSVGVGPTVPAAMRDDDPARHRMRLWASAFAGGYATYHSDQAIFALPGDTPGANAAAAVRTFFERLNHWDMTPSTEFIVESPVAEPWGLSQRLQFAAFLRTTGNETDPLVLNLPRGYTYEVRWFDPVEGNFLGRQWVPGGDRELELPGTTPYAAVAVTAQELHRTPALVELQPECLSTDFDGQIKLTGLDFLPGLHILVDGDQQGIFPLSYEDQRLAYFNAHKHLGVRVERDYELLPGTFRVRVRNHSGLISGPQTLKIVEDNAQCDENWSPDAGSLPEEDAGSPPEPSDAGSSADLGPNNDASGQEAADAGPGAEEEEADAGGCACAAVAAKATPLGSWIGWLLLAGLWTRSRRRRRP